MWAVRPTTNNQQPTTVFRGRCPVPPRESVLPDERQVRAVMNSRRNTWKALAAVALLHLAVTVVFADEEDRKPVIIAAVPDSPVAPAQLTISGQNFGVAKPLVTLDSFPLLVATFTSTNVTVW